MNYSTEHRRCPVSAVLYPANHDLAQTAAYPSDLDSGADMFGHFLHMRDHTDFPAQGLQTVQRLHHHAQRVGVQAAEAFVNERGIDLDPVGGGLS